MYTIEKLVNTLNNLTNKDFNEPDEETGVIYTKSTPAVDECEVMANELLIASNGRCNWENIRKLKSYGFKVYAGEKDSFGWLTGCIEFPNEKKVLVYG